MSQAPAHPDLAVTDPDPAADEQTSLRQFLQAQRDMVAWKLTDADDARLSEVRTSTGLSCPGIVRHLVDNERWWFRHRFAGQPDLQFYSNDEDPDGDFRPDPGDTINGLLATYVTECRAADSATADRDLGEIGANCRFSLRWIYLHMIEETARHLGHIDLLRELADGSTGSDPGQVAGEAARDAGEATS